MIIEDAYVQHLDFDMLRNGHRLGYFSSDHHIDPQGTCCMNFQVGLLNPMKLLVTLFFADTFQACEPKYQTLHI
jgi:hypothetical protein